MAGNDEIRAADSDRERIADRLRDAAAEGRLEANELEERLERAFSARTYAELDALVADLPSPGPERSRPRRRGGARRPLRGLVWVSAVLIAIWALSGAGYFWPAWAIAPMAFFALKPGGGCAFACGRRRPTQAQYL
jgi:Domain of unknown function (DUF1707)